MKTLELAVDTSFLNYVLWLALWALAACLLVLGAKLLTAPGRKKRGPR